tara:strand:+ start:352 stop:630 length:279 start_codon:yes stop_codon:yes gene_type:complete
MSEEKIKNLKKKIVNKLNKKFIVEGSKLSPLEKMITERQNKKFLIPPEKGPQPQGMKDGDFIGCPHRENGVKSDIKGIKDIQVKGKKFVGIK